jgi:hypothetical protein
MGCKVREASSWETVCPEAVGMESTQLERLCSLLAERGTRSLLIIRGDRIAYEWYAPG